MKHALYPLAATALVFAVAPVCAQAQHARISMQTARAHALAAVPHGRIRSGELETEHGRLIYSFDIQVPHRSGIEEVQISAVTGRLVSRTHESPAAERHEARTEGREHNPH
ncbi:MAG: hypothetical protein QOJ53_1664 [Sphingomonadales bacterium]|jgi:hypothetical protein|nr:hypothetical protein [Sphingomonadales bacterium]MEA3042942.1 hypothetical protein [Sphingomonadales bacterium]MEA3047332.1 hypothetical protein [Sphingomonadales bacterium]